MEKRLPKGNFSFWTEIYDEIQIKRARTYCTRNENNWILIPFDWFHCVHLDHKPNPPIVTIRQVSLDRFASSTIKSHPKKLIEKRARQYFLVYTSTEMRQNVILDSWRTLLVERRIVRCLLSWQHFNNGNIIFRKLTFKDTFLTSFTIQFSHGVRKRRYGPNRSL